MALPAKIELRTIGHACLMILEDGAPILATDPWLIGSVYWRSWWLEKYPSEADIEQVRKARFLYITHCHLDHFHWPSLRRLGPHRVLHPAFPGYPIPGFLQSRGFRNWTLEPLTWYALSDNVRVASVPVPVDDSILIVDTPNAVIFNINDGAPRRVLLERIRKTFNPAGKTAIALKSYSPASAGALTFRDGVRVPLKSKQDFVQVAIDISNALGADYFVPFASQAFFNREDSKWANGHKVTYEDLAAHWSGTKAKLCQPFVTMDLTSFAWTSAYDAVKRSLNETQLQRVRDEEEEEKHFTWSDDSTAKLKRYMDDIYFLRLLYRRGIGWRLTTSGRGFFYRPRSRTLEEGIPANHDFFISVPDKVLDDALTNGVLTDLGITLFVRIDTQVPIKLSYLFFILMGLRDYGHFKSLGEFAHYVRFYLPFVFPKLFQLAPKGPAQHIALESTTPAPLRAAS
jgi:UDP-MurNAc hydroxylase